MDSTERKKVSVISKYALDSFDEGDWLTLGQITGKVKEVSDHPRLLRSLSFGDDDYPYCVAEILDVIFSSETELIDEVVDHFDIDLWYQQKFPDKYKRVFGAASKVSADFWKEGYLRLFVSHLSSNKERMSALKASLEHWGISAFIAHEDIEASREWRNEVEAGLETMDVLAAVVEPRFKESDWCAQEVGYALGRKVEIIPLRAGMDPFGFFGKYQGLQIKGKYPEAAAQELAQLLLKKPKHRAKCLRGLGLAINRSTSKRKLETINLLDEWSVLTDENLKILLESASLSTNEKTELKNIIARVGAFAPTSPWDNIDDIPF